MNTSGDSFTQVLCENKINYSFGQNLLEFHLNVTQKSLKARVKKNFFFTQA